MATATKIEIPSLPLIDKATADQVVTQIQGLNEQLVESSKSAGNVSLDAFEKAVDSLVEIEEKAAASSQIELVTTVLTTHAKFVKDFSGAYFSAVREVLK